ncbi:MAG: flagellar biosynthesis protein FlgB [Lawsonibacter sp.]|nr:flagellar biosynthesis protein FlgB [Lawsonibacter sp.]
MELTSNNVSMLEHSMEFLWAKQASHLDNIANAETPNYKAKEVTFEESLDAQLRAAQGSAKPRAAVQKALDSSEWSVTESQASTRMDGNSVNITDQSLEAVRTAYQLQSVMRAVSGDLSILRSAITG